MTTAEEKIKALLLEWAENSADMDIMKVMVELDELFETKYNRIVGAEIVAHGYLDEDEGEGKC